MCTLPGGGGEGGPYPACHSPQAPQGQGRLPAPAGPPAHSSVAGPSLALLNASESELTHEGAGRGGRVCPCACASRVVCHYVVKQKLLTQ